MAIARYLLHLIWAPLLLGAAEGEMPADAVPFLAGEVRSVDLRPFPKWLGVLARHSETRGRVPGACTGSQFESCAPDAWDRMLDGLRGRAAVEQITAVNAVMNRAKYVPDLTNWSQLDYWETPAEFFAKDGDCEDYAIAKFASLRALGMPNEVMRIVVVQDMNLKVPHAVLAVRVGDDWMLLDNQTSHVVAIRQVLHYRPIYSINETTWWLHRR